MTADSSTNTHSAQKQVYLHILEHKNVSSSALRNRSSHGCLWYLEQLQVRQEHRTCSIWRSQSGTIRQLEAKACESKRNWVNVFVTFVCILCWVQAVPLLSELLTSSLISSGLDFDKNMCNCVKQFLLEVFKSTSPLNQPPATPVALKMIPEPILMSPLCWMKMVSQVRLPWMMGGSLEWR